MANPQTSFPHTTFLPGSFWDRRRQTVLKNTLPAQLHMLKVTGRYKAFDLKWQPIYNDLPVIWPVPKHLFWDSDVAKWIEGACYFLAKCEEGTEQHRTGVATENAVNELVSMIRGAQQEDGYLNIHYTVVEPGKRFTNLRDMHELYNAGHLIEAALAHERCFKNQQLLEPILRYVDLLSKTFGPNEDQIHGYPGHPEIELALLRLYKRTGDQKHLQLARYFIEERGNPTGVNGRPYYEVEREARGERFCEWPRYYPTTGNPYRYQQAHLPIIEQPSIEGHSVRAMYLLTAVADFGTLDTDMRTKYSAALERLWASMMHKMYMTGGIGAIAQWEGFGIDYFLPQGTDDGGCYAETCAAIGVVMLAERLLQLDLNRKYGDVMELCLFNAVLTGMSHDGKAFTYTNQLASSPDSPSKRESWFEVSCCPPNVSRLMGSLGGYLWSVVEKTKSSATVNVHLYASAGMVFKVGRSDVVLKTETNWPQEGTIKFSLQANQDVDLSVRLRIPAWASHWDVLPRPADTRLQSGYLTLPATYTRTNHTFELQIPLQPRLISPHPFTGQSVAAVARGPTMYCVEDVDNPWVDDHFKSVLFDTSVALREVKRTDIFPDETVIGVQAQGAAQFIVASEEQSPLNEGSILKLQKWRRETLHFIPYYARANRGGKGMMRVGLRTILRTDEIASRIEKAWY